MAEAMVALKWIRLWGHASYLRRIVISSALYASEKIRCDKPLGDTKRVGALDKPPENPSLKGVRRRDSKILGRACSDLD